MLILLPPSETKATRSRGARLDLGTLSLPSLTGHREQVLTALARVSARPDAAEILGVSPNLTVEIARNLALTTSPTLPAGQVYTGVLYDALDLPSLASASRSRATRRVIISSALFGALRLGDRVPAYRLSMAVNLPGVGPLAAHWRAPLDEAMNAVIGKGLIVDCRSSTYAAAWTPVPGSPAARRWVQIHVPGATHMAKHTRGLVARALCESTVDPSSPHGLLDVFEPQFVLDLRGPHRPGKPWVLSATAR